ncbi:MAG: sigma-54 dependent transcriptional regulator [Gemmatimonadota bacterium]
MARVFVDSADMDTALAIRQAAEADRHEIELVERPIDIDSRSSDSAEEVALILTSPLDSSRARRLMAPFSARVPRPPIIAVVAGDAESRKRMALEADVDECLPLPPTREEVQVVLQTLLEHFRLQRETGIVGRTEQMQDVLERVNLLAPVNSTVLITGESGTGKELAARGIHGLSRRRGKPFIAVNCGALPESLLESELFGHEKGAFTGATSRRKGVFELADTGTLFLDEIGEMSLSVQTRLLRVLESRRFMRVGGDAEIEVDVRVITATNSDLASGVRSGRFRRDLFYRLNVLHLHMPPLRDREPDIPGLIRGLIAELSAEHSREFKGLSAEAMQILLDYSWPGNVRELRNLIESMVVLAPGQVIQAEDIPVQIRNAGREGHLPVPSFSAPTEPAGPDGGAVVRLPEMEFIFRTLVELKIDVDDLRTEFERYRAEHPEAGQVRSSLPPLAGQAIEVGDGGVSFADGAGEYEEPADDSIMFGPGMTMADLERAAILATLEKVGGNRRRAAERLAIGERTLYRKLKEYGIES